MPALVYVAGVPTTVTIRWYRAPAGAQQLPFPTSIFSHVWDNNPGESVDGEIGEVGRPRTWDKGLNPGYQGQCFRGDPAWYMTGQLPPLNTIPPSACLCQIPPAMAQGGLVLGGSAPAQTPTCQPVFTPGDTPLLDQGDGHGFQPGTPHPINHSFSWSDALGISTFMLVVQSGPSCMGHGERVTFGGADQTNTISSPFELVWWDPTTRIGQWRWTQSFLYPTGYTVRVFQ